jgi:hypothetical protein
LAKLVATNYAADRQRHEQHVDCTYPISHSEQSKADFTPNAIEISAQLGSPWLKVPKVEVDHDCREDKNVVTAEIEEGMPAKSDIPRGVIAEWTVTILLLLMLQLA